MEFTVQRDTILKPLQFAAGVVEKRQTMQALSNLLIEAKKDSLTFTGSDLEVEMIGRCTELEIQTEGSTTIPARKLLDICKSLPEGSDITIKLDNSRVIVSSNKSQFSLSTISPSEYPKLEHQDSTNNFTLPQRTLRLLLQRTHFAMAQQDVRYYLNGMLLEINDQEIRTVATDGHRLALNTLKSTQNSGLDISVLIPRKAVIELMRLLEDSETELDISISPNHIRASNEEFTFTSKLLEGNYPNYSRVIPEESNIVVSMDKDLLRQSLFRASILSNEKYRGIRMELENNQIKIQANNPEQEEAHEEITIDYAFEPLELGFNVDYLLHVLDAISAQTVDLAFTDNNGGVRINEQIDNCESIYVVMPMRL